MMSDVEGNGSDSVVCLPSGGVKGGKEPNSMIAIHFFSYNTYSFLSPLVMPPVCSSSNIFFFKIEHKCHSRVDGKWFRQITFQ